MKTIVLVRHGKAESRDIDKPDYERKLVKAGEDDSLQVAGRLKKKKIKPSLMITSPAPRSLQTARICAKEFGYLSKKIRTRKALYDDTGGDFMQIIHTIEDEHDTVLLFGHNPSFNIFAEFLSRKFKKDIPKSGAVGIVFNVKTWKEITEGKGKCKLFEFPKPETKREKERSLRKELQEKLVDQIGNVFAERDAAAKEKVVKSVRKSSKKLAKTFMKKIKSPRQNKKKK